MSNLNSFAACGTGLTTIPSVVPWPDSIADIDFGYNDKLTIVEDYAFMYATNLKRLSMWASPRSMFFKTNSLYTSSIQDPAFEIYFYGPPVQEDHVWFEDNAFGNVDGGQLWSSLAVALDEFREGTFRLMLKAKFDKSADGKVTRGVYVIGIYTSRVLVSSTTLCSKKRDF